jgi:hypothetical protein
VNKRAFPLIVIIPALLAGCAIGYQARGSLSDVAGEMHGKGYPGNASDGGRFALADSDGRLQCDGQMSPPDHSPLPGSCAGESGNGVVRCSDGREVAVRWTAITCRSFAGGGEDRFGNRLIFRVDRSN